VPFVASVLFALVSAACATGQAPSNAPTSAPSTAASEAASGSPSASAAASLAPPEKPSLTVGGVVSTSDFPPRLAYELGLYKKYGLDVNYVAFEGAEQTLQAIASGQLDFDVDSPNTTLTSMTTEDPLVDVATVTDGFFDCIVTKSDIKDAATLKGKKMAISSQGGQSHAEVLTALQSLGLTADDVQIVEIGGQGARVAALQAGSVDAIPVDCIEAAQLKGAGFSTLLDLTTSTVPEPTANIGVKRAFAEANPNTVKAFLAANLEAMNYLMDPANDEQILKYYTAWTQEDAEQAKGELEALRKNAQTDLRMSPEGYENIKAVQVLGNPDIANVDSTKAFDNSYLDQLKEMGIPSS
jgi:NitT/TauT family transport system substrate-binding protein